MKRTALIGSGLLLASTLMIPSLVQAAPIKSEAPKTVVEIYRIAPGQQEAFLRFIARCDAVNEQVGLPPRQLFVHTDGADWDYLLIQPAETPPDKKAEYDAAWARSGLPSGADFAFEIRKFIASHTDTFATGPTTASDYLASAAKK